MKNSRRGSLASVLLVIIALLVIGGGVYIYENKKTQAPVIVDTGTQQSNQNQQTNTQTPPVANQQNTSANASQPTAKVICSLSGNTIDDGSSQNGLTFFAQGQSCATLSGWAPNDPTNQSLTFNGVTKTWRYVLLSFYQASFSLDGKHFAYTASNVPLPSPNPGGDWKPRRFVVSDNVASPTYDDVYYPQYSQDGKSLSYCARQNGQYLKIIDGIETVTSKDGYFNSCGSLFGNSVKGNEGLGVGADIFSPDKKIEIKSYFDPKAAGSVNCNMAECPIYISVITNGNTKIYGPYSDVVSSVAFSSDSKHFAWLLGGQVFVDETRKGESYDEAFNLKFSSDSKSITYNARLSKAVYFVTVPVN
jgi:hypothetical protein